MLLKKSLITLGLIISLISTSAVCFGKASVLKSKNSSIKLLAFAASTRKESVNKAALKILAAASTKAGAEVTVIDLADFDMPIYNEDLEAKSGLPENVKKLQKLIADSDGILLASPEYNGLPSPLCKNVFDWASREEKNNPNSGLKIFAGKAAGIIAASPGKLGGKRALPIVRTLLINLGMTVAAEQAAIPSAYTAFQTNGNLKDARFTVQLEKVAAGVVKLAKAKKLAKRAATVKK